MLYCIISEDKSYRNTRLAELFAVAVDSEIITLDDTLASLTDLEQFAYPSLFTTDSPIVHAKFLLDTIDLPEGFIKKLTASPTVFILEEFSVDTPVLTLLKKEGTIVHTDEKKKNKKESSDIFTVAQAITARDKKSKWLAYRKAIAVYPVEAVLGILYWKLRTLSTQGVTNNDYEKLYHQFLDAQMRAWKTGAPLEALIEKVILSA